MSRSDRSYMAREYMARGADTTEYEAAQSGSFWTILAAILSFIGTFGSAIAAAFGANTTGSMIASCILTIASIAANVLVNMGYIRAREAIKVASANAAAADAMAEAAAIKAEESKPESQATLM